MFHTPAHKFVDRKGPSSSSPFTEDPEFMEWWRTEGYKIHVSDATSFAFASKVWKAAQDANKM